MASKQIRVPDLGSFHDVVVIDVLVQPGETVQVDTPLMTLETEKATMDVPSSDAGVIEKLHVTKGSRVSAGSLIATLALAGDSGASAVPAAAAPAPAPAPTPAPAPAPATAAAAPPAVAASPVASAPDASGAVATGANLAHASPSVRKFARELGVELALVRGSGQKGRITAEDVKAFVKSVMLRGGAAAPSAWPQVTVPDFAQFGPIEVKPLTRVQRISGPRVQASWVNLPHVTQFDEADISELETERKRLQGGASAAGIKLTPLAFVVMACVKALQKFPQFNASLDSSGENLIYKKYIHIGFAADTPQGLLVPVIRDANRKDIYETARALAELAEKARAGKLSGAQMQGGSFTISSLGGIGGSAFTPIINAPEVAILGVSRASMRPVFQEREQHFVPRLILPLSLSYDHRVIDGAAGVRFTSYLASVLADPHALLEAVP